MANASPWYAATDPVAAVNGWLDIRGRAPAALFTSSQRRTVRLDPISGQAIAIVLRKRARDAGYGGERITPHSLRAGHATSAAVAGVALDRIAAQTRHKRLSTLIERYLRPAQAPATPPVAISGYDPLPRHTSQKATPLLPRENKVTWIEQLSSIVVAVRGAVSWSMYQQ